MRSFAEPWDYLILTASNDQQAAIYQRQLAMRRRLRLLGGVRQTLVVADPGGRRVGSGGSTIACLLAVLNRELAGVPADRGRPELWADALGRLRILIIHAGGDSRRLPAYGPCGKIFVPLPGPSDSALGTTLFDRQLPVYLDLPPLEDGAGQVTIAAGDVLLGFDPRRVRFAPRGITGLASPVSAEEASGHGVYCLDGTGGVRRFLQKPSPAQQRRHGADHGNGRAMVDIGVFSFDAATAVSLLRMCDVQPDAAERLGWRGPWEEAILGHGLDFYREIGCALGTESTLETYRSALQASDSSWNGELLERLFHTVSPIPCRAQVLDDCEFLHFGTTGQIIRSGQELLRRGDGGAPPPACVSINNRLAAQARVVAENAWVEGCSIEDRLVLGGDNVLVGVDVRQALELPSGACLDVLPGRDRKGRAVSFIRCYHKDDRFHNAPAADATFCGRPVSQWLAAAGADPDEVWGADLPHDRRTAWNARLFPAEDDPAAFQRWLWMFQSGDAGADQYRAWRQADRYCLEEIAALADQGAFHQRRAKVRSEEIRRSLRKCFSRESGFSAADLAYVLAESSDPGAWLAELLAEARRHWELDDAAVAEEGFVFSRIMHAVGTAVLAWTGRPAAALPRCFLGLEAALGPAGAEWLAELKLAPDPSWTVEQWAGRARASAFEYLRREIVGRGSRSAAPGAYAIRSDEIVWGRAPARLDLAGGWTDTPPYSLEHGGCVVNAAVLLNGQPPVQVFARLTPEPLISLASIDLGTRLVIDRWEELLDYGSPTGEFSLVKAALALAGLSPGAAAESWRESLRERLVRIGGGLELTTLAAIPKGSGLGTSSIMGAVVLSVIHRVMGRRLSPAELFHAVLRLEQTLTTGGGWQDQVGGAVGGLKSIAAPPGMIPQPSISPLPAELLDPRANGGCTLLYYTGITRLAKNILEEVVGRYLDRDRETAAALRAIHAMGPQMAEVVAGGDLAAFGRLIGGGWALKKRLDPHSSNAEIEALLSRIGPHLHGATLLGAGGGGFLLLVCKSAADAACVRDRLESSPPNPRARFFDFEISREGLSLSVC